MNETDGSPALTRYLTIVRIIYKVLNITCFDTIKFCLFLLTVLIEGDTSRTNGTASSARMAGE